MNRHDRRKNERNITEKTRIPTNEEQISVLKQAFDAAKSGRPQDAARLCENLCSAVLFGDISLTAAKLWVGVEPGNYKALNNYGLLCQNNGMSAQAIPVLEKALEINPGGLDAMMTLCNAWHKEGNFKKAKTYSDALIYKYHKGDHPYVIEARARLLWDMGLKDEAFAIAKKLHGIAPDEIVANHLLGRMLIEFERDEEALPYILKCRELNPEVPVYTFNLALVYEAMGRMDEARREFLSALDMFNKNDPDKSKFAKEREKIEVLAGGINEKYVIYKFESFDVLNESYPFVDSIRNLGNNYEIIELSSAMSVTNEWVILQDGKIYADMLMTNDDHLVKGFRNAQTEAVMNTDFPKYDYDEPCILLGGAVNYYHWLCDYLPRMELIDACNDLKDLPIIIQDEMKPYHIESLKMLGYDPARFICAPRRHYLHFKKVYIPHIKHRPMSKDGKYDLFEPALKKESLDWLRAKFAPYLKPSPDMPKRIFISRKDAKFRRCENEDAVFELAKQYGFEKVQNENMTFEQQVALYAGAEAVMGAHGAGFTNMIFATEGATLIELFPMATEAKFFKKICGFLNQNNYGVYGPRTNSLKIPSRQFWDFEVDLKDVATVLEKLGKPQ